MARLTEVSPDSTTYSDSFKLFLENEHVPTIGESIDIAEVHRKIVQPYIGKICRNIEKRFGDSAGHIIVAASVFTAANVENPSLEQQLNQLQLLSQFFKLNDHDISAEWTCFRKFLEKHKTEDCDVICKHLLNSDIGNSFPQTEDTGRNFAVVSCWYCK